MGEAKRRQQLDPAFGTPKPPLRFPLTPEQSAFIRDYVQLQESSDPIENGIFPGDYIALSLIPEEIKRLESVIRNYVQGNPELKGWVFPTQIANSANLAQAAVNVLKFAEFNALDARFGEHFNGDPNLTFVLFTRKG